MIKHPIRILFVHHSAAWGGAAGCLITLITHLDREKYLPEVLLLKESETCNKLAENGIKFRIAESDFYKKHYKFLAHSEAGYIKWYNLPGFFNQGISWLLSRYFFAGDELSRHDFDIVHLNSSALTDWLAPAKRRGKVVIHIREPLRKGKFDILNNFFRKQILKYADQVIAISNDNAERLRIPGKTNIIYDFCQRPQSAPNLSSYSSKKVLYLGGSSSSKGFYTVADSLDYIDKDVKIIFAGKYVLSENHQSLKGVLKYLFSKARMRNSALRKIMSHSNAEMIGLIYNVSEYLEEVTCLISPFKVPHFSFPVVEANMHRKAAIGSDVQGMEEIIKNEENGLIIEKDNPKALAAAINRVTSQYCLAVDLGEKGYATAIKRYSPGNVVLFEKIYDNLSDL